MLAGYGNGNHCLFVIDSCANDIVGQSHLCIARASSCCLNTRIPQVAAEYVPILEGKVLQHCLIEQMG
jgi:hypothetical protein